MSDETQKRPFHSVAIKLDEANWRKFRALVSLSKVEVGVQVGEIIKDWLAEPAQRAILSNLGN